MYYVVSVGSCSGRLSAREVLRCLMDPAAVGQSSDATLRRVGEVIDFASEGHCAKLGSATVRGVARGPGGGR